MVRKFTNVKMAEGVGCPVSSTSSTLVESLQAATAAASTHTFQRPRSVDDWIPSSGSTPSVPATNVRSSLSEPTTSLAVFHSGLTTEALDVNERDVVENLDCFNGEDSDNIQDFRESVSDLLAIIEKDMQDQCEDEEDAQGRLGNETIPTAASLPTCQSNTPTNLPYLSHLQRPSVPLPVPGNLVPAAEGWLSLLSPLSSSNSTLLIPHLQVPNSAPPCLEASEQPSHLAASASLQASSTSAFVFPDNVPAPTTSSASSSIFPGASHHSKSLAAAYQFPNLSTKSREDTPLSSADLGATLFDSNAHPDNTATPKEMVKQMLLRKGVTAPAPSAAATSAPDSKKEDHELTPAELKKLERRREKNKAAASRCRQRQRSRITKLDDKTEDLMKDQAALVKERDGLAMQCQYLQGILDAHNCVRTAATNSEKADAATENNEFHEKACSGKSADRAADDELLTSLHFTRTLSLEDGRDSDGDNDSNESTSR